MVSKLFSTFIIILCAGFNYCASECDPTQCPSPPKHYQELKCREILEPGQCCPTQYECPNFSQLDPEKCHVNGKIFNRGDQIPDDDVRNPCKKSCFCDESSSPARLHCAYVECPEYLGPAGFINAKEGCVKQQAFDSCCTLKTVCDDEDIENLEVCELDGKTYRSGQGMYPESHTCHFCICGSGFNETDIENSPHCQKQHCGVDHNMFKIQKGCIPIYYGTMRCCPINWRCPSDKKDEVVYGIDRADSPDASGTCNFGKLKMNIGDSLNQRGKNVTCACLTPPFPHCVQEPYVFT